MESILAAAFGRVINLQRGEADEITEAAKGVFDAGKNMVIQFSMLIVSKFKLPFCGPLCQIMVKCVHTCVYT